MERTNPQTSLDAWRSMDGKILADHYCKILTALDLLGTGIYEEIATQVGFTDKNQVSRRLAELERMELVYKTGEKGLTKSNRQAFKYKIRTKETIVPNIEKFTPPDTTAADYANMIIANTKLGKAFQAGLFDDEK